MEYFRIQKNESGWLYNNKITNFKQKLLVSKKEIGKTINISYYSSKYETFLNHANHQKDAKKLS